MIAAKAKEARSHMEYVLCGLKYIWKRKSDSPDWVYDLCMHAHVYMLPDDFRYEMIVEALNVLCEGDNAADMSIPNAGILLDWLASHSDRVGFCDLQLEEGYHSTSLIDIISTGYIHEANEILDLVRSFLENMEEEA